MPTSEEFYDKYLRAASAPEQDERMRLLRECAVDDFEIVSPFPYVVRGTEAVAAKLGEVAAAVPGGALRLQRSTPLDEHNDVFRAGFENRDAAGAVLSTGLHIGQTRDGKLVRLLVFVPFETPSAPAS